MSLSDEERNLVVRKELKAISFIDAIEKLINKS